MPTRQICFHRRLDMRHFAPDLLRERRPSPDKSPKTHCPVGLTAPTVEMTANSLVRDTWSIKNSPQIRPPKRLEQFEPECSPVSTAIDRPPSVQNAASV